MPHESLHAEFDEEAAAAGVDTEEVTLLLLCERTRPKAWQTKLELAAAGRVQYKTRAAARWQGVT